MASGEDDASSGIFSWYCKLYRGGSAEAKVDDRNAQALKGGCYQSGNHVPRKACISADDYLGVAGLLEYPSTISSGKFDHINGSEAFAWLAADGASYTRDRFN